MISRRKYDPLGVVLATDEGLLQVEPGREPVVAVAGKRFERVDFRDGLGLAAAPGEGVWVFGGKHWELGWEGDARSVSVTSSGELFIGSVDGRLHVSKDKGAKWATVDGVQNLIKLNRFAPPPGVAPYVAAVGEVLDGIVIAVVGGGCWHTRDGGTSWLRRTDGLDPKVHRLWVHPERRDRLYATSPSGIYRSEDEGYTWVQSIGGLDRSWGGTLAVLPGTPDTLVYSAARRAGTEGALFRSANGGVTWQRIMLDADDEWDRAPCVVRPYDWDDLSFVAAGTQLWASHDRGKNWLALQDGLPVANDITAAL
ncbi:MAG: hypothetical protein EPO16_03675 [Dehalococcoidia bacterium]|nr:MAG: hypothetical protein EPO16_03675 [Dehalococcoidia bacterium]